MPITTQNTDLQDVVLLSIPRYGDARGWFMEAFKQSVFTQLNMDGGFVQDNFSRSTRGVLRGLHFQSPPHAQGKLILPLTGKLYDVALDLRRGSPTYGRWQGFHLEADQSQALWIPPGFAHGFQVVSKEVLFWYKVTAEYAPHSEGGICWNDPDLAIDWPVPQPLLSPRDGNWPRWSGFSSLFSY